MSKNRSRKTTIIIVGLGVILFLAAMSYIGEIWAKKLVALQSGPFRFNDMLHYEQVPGYFGIPYHDKFLYELAINSNGFRGPEIKKDTKAVRVVAVGDSFTFGESVKWDETYVVRLADMLEKKTGKSVEAVNAGTRGYNIIQSRTTMAMRTFLLGPRLVVYGLYADDFEDLGSSTYVVDDKGDLKVNPNSGLGQDLKNGDSIGFMEARTYSDFSRNMMKKSRLFDVLYHRYYLFSESPEKSAEKRYRTFSTMTRNLLEGKQNDETVLALTKADQVIIDMQKLVNAAGGKLIILLIPPIDIINNPSRQNLYNKLRISFQLRGIAFVDLQEVILNTGKPVKRYYMPLDWHLTKEGHMLAAEALAAKIGTKF